MTVHEIDGMEHIDLLQTMNGYEPDVFPPLQSRHFSEGFWWVAVDVDNAVGFAGLVPMVPFDSVAYFKRAYVLPDYRGRGLQREFMRLREQKARDLGYTMLVSECSAANAASQRNFELSGFGRCTPEQCWGDPGSVYFVKRL